MIVAALLSAACNPVVDNLETYGLNCKAKEISVLPDTLERSYSVTFNSRGQAVERITYNEDGEVRYREISYFDKKGRLSEIQGINGENETEIRYEYEWDGRFVRECRMYGMNNDELHRWVHKNDGRHIVHTTYFSEGEENYVTTKSYKGNSYIEVSYAPDGSELGRADIDFLTDSKPTKIDGAGIYVEIDYNEKGLPVRSLNTILDSAGEMEWTPDLEVHPERFYFYEYDDRGNWTKRTERIHPDSTTFAVITRRIVY